MVFKEAAGNWNGNSQGRALSAWDSVKKAQWSKGKITHKHRRQGQLCQGRAEARLDSHKTATEDNFSMLASGFYRSQAVNPKVSPTLLLR